MYPTFDARNTEIPNSRDEIRFTASSNDSPKRTVPPGKCHWPIHGSIDLCVRYTLSNLLIIRISTVKRGTFEYISLNSAWESGFLSDITSTIAMKRDTKNLLNLIIISWQGRQDLNLRHLVLETSALPTELHPYLLAWLTALFYAKNTELSSV